MKTAFAKWLRGRGFDPATLDDSQVAALELAYGRDDAAPLEFAGEVELQAADAPGDRPRLTIMAYTGGAMRVGYFGDVAIDLSTLRLGASVPLLADHDATVAGTIGQGTPKVSGGKLRIEGELASTETAEQVSVLLRDGVKLQASVGTTRGDQEFIAPGGKVAVNGRTLTAGRDGLTVIRNAELREVSILPLGADPKTTVSIAAAYAAHFKKGNSMKGFLHNHDASDNTGGATVERRQAALIAAYECDVLPPKTLAAIRAAAIERGDTFERFEHAAKAAALDHIRASRANVAINPPRGRSVADADAGDIVACALMRRVSPRSDLVKMFGDRVANQAGDIKARHCIDTLKALWTIRGERAPDDLGDMVKASGFSTNNISNVVGNVANKVAVEAYASYDQAWRPFTQIVNLNDLKEHSRIRLSLNNGVMDVVGSGGELKHGSLADSADTMTPATYGKMLGLTRTDLINDDLGMLATLPRELAKSAARSVSNVAFTTWLAGIAANHWTTGRGNYFDGAATTLGYASLATALRMLRTMEDENGYPIVITPVCLVVPPELETEARELVLSGTIARTGADALPEGNAMQGLNLDLVVEPRLSNSLFTGNSAVAWYLTGGPADGPLVAGFLDGKDAPTIETSDADFNTLGIQMRGFIDFGFSRGDYRASIRSKGAV